MGLTDPSSDPTGTRNWPLAVIALGGLTLMFGIAYWFAMVGQHIAERSPEVMQRTHAHATVATVIWWIGGGLIVLGVAFAVIELLANHRRGRRGTPGTNGRID